MTTRVEPGLSAIMVSYQKGKGLTTMTHLFTFSLGDGKAFTMTLRSAPWSDRHGHERLKSSLFEAYAPMLSRIWLDESDHDKRTWLEMRGGLTPRGAGFGEDWVLWAEL